MLQTHVDATLTVSNFYPGGERCSCVLFKIKVCQSESVLSAALVINFEDASFGTT